MTMITMFALLVLSIVFGASPESLARRFRCYPEKYTRGFYPSPGNLKMPFVFLDPTFWMFVPVLLFARR